MLFYYIGNRTIWVVPSDGRGPFYWTVYRITNS